MIFGHIYSKTVDFGHGYGILSQLSQIFRIEVGNGHDHTDMIFGHEYAGSGLINRSHGFINAVTDMTVGHMYLECRIMVAVTDMISGHKYATFRFMNAVTDMICGHGDMRNIKCVFRQDSPLIRVL